MKSREYWNKRFELLEVSQLNKGAKYYAELEKQYLKACSDVQKEVDAWYSRFATENGISLQDAMKLLNSNELEEFHWNVQEYIKKGRTLNISNEWKHQLKNASAKFHVTRLESLKLQMQNHVEVLYGNESDEVASLMRKIYEDGYYHTAYEIQKGYGIGYSLMKLDTNTVEKVINKPWAADGSNFSSRIWKSKNQLVNELHNGLTQAIIQGKNSYQVTEQIAKRFNVGKAQAGRLVATESAFFSSASRKDCFKELGVEEFQIVATLDNRTSEICQSLDGQHFPMSEYEIGVTAPPFHPNCRTTTVPYFDDEFTLNETRAARDAGGKTYEVPGDITYREWAKEFPQDALPTKSKVVSVKARNKSADTKQFDNYSKVLGDEYIDFDFDEFQDIKYSDSKKYGELKHAYRVANSFEGNAGNMSKKTIVSMGDDVINAKSNFTGASKKKGNTAELKLDGITKIANSQIPDKDSAGYKNFKGDKNQIAFVSENPMFEAKVIGSHDRTCDSEKTLFEYAATICADGKSHTLELLSEKCMCESCLGVMKQFTNRFPNVKIHVVSGRKDRVFSNKINPLKYMVKKQ